MILPKFDIKHFAAIICCALIGLLPAAGCTQTNRVDAPNAAARTDLREVTDDLGRRIVVPAKIERVVSLAPNVTENVFAVGAGSKLVGVTTYCDYPAEAQKIAKIGDTIAPNLETIIALKPQLIIASTDSQLEAFIRRADAQNIAVFVTDAKSLDAVFKDLRALGDLLGTKEQAEKLVADLQKRQTAIEEKVKGQTPVKTFFQVSPEPFTIGRASFITDLIERAGGVSVTADAPESYFKISKETAVALQPEAIILSVNEAMGANNNEPFEAFRSAPAIKNNRVYRLNGDLLVRPGARLVDGLEALAKALHPNVFR